NQVIEPPTRRAVAMAVSENPFAGRYVEQLDELITIGEELGALLGRRCVQALGIDPGQVESYGKAAIVGEDGELEHAAAILHPKLGAPLRAAVEKGAALVPSSKKRGTLGTAIDIPLGHKDAAYVRSHFDAIEARIADAPRASEIVVAIAVTDSGRPLARIGGLQAGDIKGEDGLG
ncbi:MAG: amino acid synthesis family protein, partial [Burkholderiaceae bacterium]